MTTRVLVLGDTHLRLGAGLPTPVLELAERADHVVHTGDLVRIDVLDTLAALAPVTAVAGNVDDAEVASRLPEHATIELDGVTIGVVHDGGRSDGRHERLRGLFPGAGIVAYGHSHMPELTTLEDGLVVCNPGSATQRRRAPTHTVAWFEIRAGAVTGADLVHLD